MKPNHVLTRSLQRRWAGGGCPNTSVDRDQRHQAPAPRLHPASGRQGDLVSDLDDYALRARTWLAANAGGLPAEPDLSRSRQFMAALYDAGYSGITWPAEYGGQGLSAAEERAFQQASRDFTLPIHV